MNANPVLVEVTRGEMVESRHRGAVALAHSNGQTISGIGDVARLIYPRSALKPLQALHLIESGAAAAYQLGEREIALACASHNGEEPHVAAVVQWLKRLGLDESALECGAHPPRRSFDREALLSQGKKPGPAHNNCSGKHCGFLTAALHGEHPPQAYIAREHPVQQAVMTLIGELAGISLQEAPHGIDGCGIPVAGIPLDHLAMAFARFASGDGLSGGRASAARQVYDAMVNEPFMVAGTNRWCTNAIEAGRGAFIVKTGAEGVYCAAIPEAGIGVALKIDDGAHRASECAMGAVLSKIPGLRALFADSPAELIRVPVKNVAGKTVGEIAPGSALQELTITNLG
ncbi:MAG: asparaginase [Acidiferrobacteraceae bacterium]|nr:asparaginase [Acidiferrobacteraceae bacterium]MBT5623243.1 asparaginase [Acidiferrobacteraceae bacterium]MBT5886974.1 asparaginase [Acidiferrobacteraceae bacterium]MBT6787310.1 asparaginase [Acidiferrobacteraceae bacterium]